ncbi:TIGR02530 family flagellar biosynthesis protein [Alloiococcus sp. CFN-8]|uniref:TIGR02530 family flagellar biosynthesis protein n=1 Tax=Alloiococcus sp. CFN-8 TaxID=3416081 RepID=UPI003CEAFE77
MSYRIVNGRPQPIEGIITPVNNQSLNRKSNTINYNESFKEVLDKEIYSDLSYKISAHAKERVKELELSQKDLKSIGYGIEKARSKGSKNALILYKDIAFIASCENKTLITAVEKERAKDNVFTNIDSMVML